MGKTMKKISIGVCCYNEEGNIKECYERITKEVSKLSRYEYEIIFADNASTDKTRAIIREIAENDVNVKVIFNQINYGFQKSGYNMLNKITGDVYIAIPADLQDPPELISVFIQEWEKGYDVVWGQKVKSEESKLKYFLRTCYYKIIKKLSNTPQFEHVTGYGAQSSWVIKHWLEKGDPSVSLRHKVGEWGCEIKLIPYSQQKRNNGKSSFSIGRYFTFAMNSMINTSVAPLRVATISGAFMSGLSFMVAIFYLFYKVFNWNEFVIGMAPVVIGVFFLGSVQLLTIGIVGEYVGMILNKLQKDNTVIEKELINFDAKKENSRTDN